MRHFYFINKCMNEKYFHLKASVRIKETLFNMAENWKHQTGNYPSYNDFVNLLNENMGIEIVKLSESNYELNENSISNITKEILNEGIGSTALKWVLSALMALQPAAKVGATETAEALAKQGIKMVATETGEQVGKQAGKAVVQGAERAATKTPTPASTTLAPPRAPAPAPAPKVPAPAPTIPGVPVPPVPVPPAPTPPPTPPTPPPTPPPTQPPPSPRPPPILPSKSNKEEPLYGEIIQDLLAPGERYASKVRASTYDPFLKRYMTQEIMVNEGKLSPRESLKRRTQKQKYKVIYVQDGKKVEVFASSLRGVRRVIYGKKNFRVMNTTGSDLTGYFKKLMKND